MGKSDVIMTFDADTASFVQKQIQMRNEILATANVTRDAGNSAATAGDKFSSMTGKVAGFVAGVASVSAGIRLVTQDVEQYFSLVDARATESLRRIREVSGAAAASGQQQFSPQITAGLENIRNAGGMNVNPEQRADMFSAISRAMGARISVDQKLAATQTGMMAINAGMDPEDAQQAAIMFANFQQLQGIGGFAGVSPDALRDLSKRAFEIKPEGFTQREMQFLAHATDSQSALNMLLGGKLADQSGRAVSSIEQQADTKFPRNPEAAIERWMNNPQQAPAAIRQEIVKVKAGMQQLAGVGFQSYGAQIQSRLGSTDAGVQADVQAQRAGTAEAVSAGMDAAANAKYQSDLRSFRAIYDIEHPGGGIFREVQARIGASFGGESAQEFARSNIGDPSTLAKSQLDALEQIGVDIKQLVGVQRTRRDVALDSGKAGQQ